MDGLELRKREIGPFVSARHDLTPKGIALAENSTRQNDPLPEPIHAHGTWTGEMFSIERTLSKGWKTALPPPMLPTQKHPNFVGV
ncbi:MAG: hypothetical protein V1800_06900 [Candidatus Latescibacterota bacterium]